MAYTPTTRPSVRDRRTGKLRSVGTGKNPNRGSQSGSSIYSSGSNTGTVSQEVTVMSQAPEVPTAVPTVKKSSVLRPSNGLATYESLTGMPSVSRIVTNISPQEAARLGNIKLQLIETQSRIAREKKKTIQERNDVALANLKKKEIVIQDRISNFGKRSLTAEELGVDKVDTSKVIEQAYAKGIMKDFGEGINYNPQISREQVIGQFGLANSKVTMTGYGNGLVNEPEIARQALIETGGNIEASRRILEAKTRPFSPYKIETELVAPGGIANIFGKEKVEYLTSPKGTVYTDEQVLNTEKEVERLNEQVSNFNARVKSQNFDDLKGAVNSLNQDIEEFNRVNPELSPSVAANKYNELNKRQAQVQTRLNNAAIEEASLKKDYESLSLKAEAVDRKVQEVNDLGLGRAVLSVPNRQIANQKSVDNALVVNKAGTFGLGGGGLEPYATGEAKLAAAGIVAGEQLLIAAPIGGALGTLGGKAATRVVNSAATNKLAGTLVRAATSPTTRLIGKVGSVGLGAAYVSQAASETVSAFQSGGTLGGVAKLVEFGGQTGGFIIGGMAAKKTFASAFKPKSGLFEPGRAINMDSNRKISPEQRFSEPSKQTSFKKQFTIENLDKGGKQSKFNVANIDKGLPQQKKIGIENLYRGKEVININKDQSLRFGELGSFKMNKKGSVLIRRIVISRPKPSVTVPKTIVAKPSYFGEASIFGTATKTLSPQYLTGGIKGYSRGFMPAIIGIPQITRKTDSNIIVNRSIDRILGIQSSRVQLSSLQSSSSKIEELFKPAQAQEPITGLKSIESSIVIPKYTPPKPIVINPTPIPTPKPVPPFVPIPGFGFMDKSQQEASRKRKAMLLRTKRQNYLGDLFGSNKFSMNTWRF